MSIRMLKFKVTPYGTFESGQVVAGLPAHMEYRLMESGDAASVEVTDFAAAVVGAAGVTRDDGRLLLFGDSQTQRESLTTATDFSNLNTGIVAWANVFGQRRWEVVENLGVVGDTTDDMIARLPAALEAVKSCGTVLISGSTNDLFGDLADSDHVIGNLEEIFNAFLGIGVRVIWKNETPRTFIDATKVAYQHAVNAWGKGFERITPGFSVFDAADVLADPTSTQFAAKAAYLDGSVHYLNSAACLLGKAFNAKYGSEFIPRSNLIKTASDTYAVSTTSSQLFGNPLFAGTAGTKTATGGGTAPTGTVADLVQVDHAVNTTATCVCSLVADSDGCGQAQRLVIAGVTSAALADRWTARNITNISAGVSPGDLIELEYKLVAASHEYLSCVAGFLQVQVDGGAIHYGQDMRNTTTDVALPADFVGGTYRTRRLRIPTGAAITALQFRIEPRFTLIPVDPPGEEGVATIDISRLSIRNLTRLGLDT